MRSPRRQRAADWLRFCADRKLHGGGPRADGHMKRVVTANPLEVKAIAHTHVKTDKVDAVTLASLHAADYLPEICTPDAATERIRRLMVCRDLPLNFQPPGITPSAVMKRMTSSDATNLNSVQ